MCQVNCYCKLIYNLKLTTVMTKMTKDGRVGGNMPDCSLKNGGTKLEVYL